MNFKPYIKHANKLEANESYELESPYVSDSAKSYFIDKPLYSLSSEDSDEAEYNTYHKLATKLYAERDNGNSLASGIASDTGDYDFADEWHGDYDVFQFGLQFVFHIYDEEQRMGSIYITQ